MALVAGGITASEGPGPDTIKIDGIERRFFDYVARGVPYGPDDGTLAPWAVVASLPFAPEIVLFALHHCIHAGRSSDTTMGFSPLEGLMMATRSGSIDPGVLLYLQQHCEVGVDELRETLTKRSGLRGVSGVSGDLREVLEAADRGSSRAQLAYERFVLSIRRALGAMAGVLGGVDAVVFTGGIGENSARVRRDAMSALRFAGLELAEDANASGDADREIAVRASRVHVLVIRAREDLAILKEVLRLRGHADARVEASE